MDMCRYIFLQYVRVSHDAKAEDVLELLKDSWGLELPKLLIEITGGAKDFVLQPKLRRIFQQGIVRVAESTNAWIITGGTNTGNNNSILLLCFVLHFPHLFVIPCKRNSKVLQL